MVSRSPTTQGQLRAKATYSALDRQDATFECEIRLFLQHRERKNARLCCMLLDEPAIHDGLLNLMAPFTPEELLQVFSSGPSHTCFARSINMLTRHMP